MSDLSSTVSLAFVQYLEEFRDKAHKLVAPISVEQLWRKPYPYGNSIGHLLLHITGNLNDRIGAQIVGTGYQRDRNREFTDPEKRPKEEVLGNLDGAVAMVVEALRKQSTDDWSTPYFAKTGPPARDNFSVFTRCLTHCYHHLGQIIYLTKELDRSSADTPTSSTHH